MKDDAVSVSWPRFYNQLANLLMIFAICHSNDDLTGDYEVYSLRNSFSKKAAQINMSFQTCTLHVLHCYKDEGGRISGYISF